MCAVDFCTADNITAGGAGARLSPRPRDAAIQGGPGRQRGLPQLAEHGGPAQVRHRLSHALPPISSPQKALPFLAACRPQVPNGQAGRARRRAGQPDRHRLGAGAHAHPTESSPLKTVPCLGTWVGAMPFGLAGPLPFFSRKTVSFLAALQVRSNKLWLPRQFLIPVTHRLTAAIPMENPYCSCKTPPRVSTAFAAKTPPRPCGPSGAGRRRPAGAAAVGGRLLPQDGRGAGLPEDSPGGGGAQGAGGGAASRLWPRCFLIQDSAFPCGAAFRLRFHCFLLHHKTVPLPCGAARACGPPLLSSKPFPRGCSQVPESSKMSSLAAAAKSAAESAASFPNSAAALQVRPPYSCNPYG